jgi:hypothetical protein
MIKHALPEKHKNNMKLNNINTKQQNFVKHSDQACGMVSINIYITDNEGVPTTEKPSVL